ncbi:MAG TPA: hypothetical protein VGX91_02980 [Candidatus Cybelea sp.]|jgi:hypothetical protein|nr:hypothetical protein [Candidatus Cybelea sp.]
MMPKTCKKSLPCIYRGAGLRAQISIQVVMMLLWTRHSDCARSFLPVPASLDGCDDYHREVAAYFERDTYSVAAHGVT